MKVRYNNSLDDMVAFNQYHFAHSPAFRHTRAAYAVTSWVFPVVVVTVGLNLGIAAAVDGVEFEVAVTLIGGALIFGLCGLLFKLWPWQYRGRLARAVDRSVRRQYRGGANKTMLGTHELELTATHLIERTACNENIMKLEAVEGVVGTGDFAIIYTSSVAGHFIPRDAVIDGDYEKFVAAVARRVYGADHDYRES
jgi:hypothetical protein